MQIHTHIYWYIQIHTHIQPSKTGLDKGFLALQRALETLWWRAIPPDHLECYLRRDRRTHTWPWMPIGGTRDSLYPLPTRLARAGAPKRVGEWVPDGGVKWSDSCPGSPRVGPAGCRPRGGSFEDATAAWMLVWANTHNTDWYCKDMTKIHTIHAYTNNTYIYIHIYNDTFVLLRYKHTDK